MLFEINDRTHKSNSPSASRGNAMENSNGKKANKKQKPKANLITIFLINRNFSNNEFHKMAKKDNNLEEIAKNRMQAQKMRKKKWMWTSNWTRKMGIIII